MSKYFFEFDYYLEKKCKLCLKLFKLFTKFEITIQIFRYYEFTFVL